MCVPRGHPFGTLIQIASVLATGLFRLCVPVKQLHGHEDTSRGLKSKKRSLKSKKRRENAVIALSQLPTPPLCSAMEPSAQKLAIVRVSRNRQGEPSPASKTIECASSRRLSRLASANVTRPDAGRLSLASPRTQLVSRPEGRSRSAAPAPGCLRRAFRLESVRKWKIWKILKIWHGKIWKIWKN